VLPTVLKHAKTGGVCIKQEQGRHRPIYAPLMDVPIKLGVVEFV